jgi:hypothetical protein
MVPRRGPRDYLCARARTHACGERETGQEGDESARPGAPQ